MDLSTSVMITVSIAYDYWVWRQVFVHFFFHTRPWRRRTLRYPETRRSLCSPGPAGRRSAGSKPGTLSIEIESQEKGFPLLDWLPLPGFVLSHFSKIELRFTESPLRNSFIFNIDYSMLSLPSTLNPSKGQVLRALSSTWASSSAVRPMVAPAPNAFDDTLLPLLAHHNKMHSDFLRNHHFPHPILQLLFVFGLWHWVWRGTTS